LLLAVDPIVKLAIVLLDLELPNQRRMVSPPMASSGFSPDHPVERMGTVLIDEIRTATAAGCHETVFEGVVYPGTLPVEPEELLDLEERVRRLVVHHLNDTGIPISAKRPQTVEASPEFLFFLRGATAAVRAAPVVYKVLKGSWHTRQDQYLKSFHRTAVISIDLKNNTEHLLAAIAGLPLLQQNVLEKFPGINLHIRIFWRATTHDPDTRQIRGDGPAGSLTITSGCTDRDTVVRVLKQLTKNRNQDLVVLRGRRWKSLGALRAWVLPQEHPWAAARNNSPFTQQPTKR